MRIEYPTLFLAILCYSLFIGAAILLWPVAPAAAILVMAVMGALQSSLAHECLHGHPFRNPHVCGERSQGKVASSHRDRPIMGFKDELSQLDGE